MMDPAELTGTFIDQWIIAGMEKGRQEGRQRGLEEGLEIGLRTGVQQGVHQGLVQAVQSMLQGKFGRVPARTMTRVQALTAPDLNELLQTAFKFETAKDLNAWLKERDTAPTH